MPCHTNVPLKFKIMKYSTVNTALEYYLEAGLREEQKNKLKLKKNKVRYH